MKYNISLLRFSNAIPHGNQQPGKEAAERFQPRAAHVTGRAGRLSRFPTLPGGIRARRSLPAGIPQPGIPEPGLCCLIIYLMASLV